MSVHFSALLLPLLLLIGRHDFHTSLAEIQYDQPAHTLEVSLRVFTDDLETALAKSNNGKVIKVTEAATADPFIQNYLAKHFRLVDGSNRPRPIAWLGKEISVDVTWLYFEVKEVESLTGKRLQNALFMELFNDQINMVNFKLPAGNRSYLFNTADPEQAIGASR